ncbi:hypothetical protein D3C71_1536580 [compost metagenome]
MDGGVEAKLLIGAGQIVNLAIGDEDCGTKPGRWHVGHGGAKRRVEAGRGRVAIRVVRDFDNAGLDIRVAGKAVTKFGQRLVGLLLAPIGLLALGAVYDDRHDGRELFAVFLKQCRVGKRQEQEGERQHAQA